MIKNKKGSIAGFIIMIVFLVIGLLAFVLFMPTALPFIDLIGNSNADPLTKFLAFGIPIFTVFALIVGTVMS